MKTSYSLHMTLHQGDQERILARTDTEEPQVMAATLRALADRLDPPKSLKPVHRRTEDVRITSGPLAGMRQRRTRITTDGCGPEHTHEQGCAYWGGKVAE